MQTSKTSDLWRTGDHFCTPCFNLLFNLEIGKKLKMKMSNHKIFVISLFILSPFAGDLIGKLLAYISLLPIAIIVGFLAVLLLRRELHTVSSFVTGCVKFCKNSLI